MESFKENILLLNEVHDAIHAAKKITASFVDSVIYKYWDDLYKHNQINALDCEVDLPKKLCFSEEINQFPIRFIPKFCPVYRGTVEIGRISWDRYSVFPFTMLFLTNGAAVQASDVTRIGDVDVTSLHKHT